MLLHDIPDGLKRHCKLASKEHGQGPTVVDLAKQKQDPSGDPVHPETFSGLVVLDKEKGDGNQEADYRYEHPNPEPSIPCEGPYE